MTSDGGAPRQSSAEVLVTATECSEEAAHVLVDVLERAFPASPAARPAREPGPGAKATVWSTTVDAAEVPRTADPIRLNGTVRVGLQGSPRAVDRVVAALAGAFVVDGTGTVAGDQEKETDLLIRSA
ncbi:MULTISPECIES: hypothetical protein [unclassified Streptomyces]|uniref:hypothetical protein n=1 Tax=unclassified Streptomyces TaxID=2593676 RepID=UPI002255F4FA|nr:MULTISPECIES: hypothetical protein [unclassified Streptomyces]MCX4625169.1 hypothetical protein [Streptomyces sp. NBC_01443]MCX4633534.1 hypothetical protein [Streptomyces sp. NBC_01443]WSW49724.1 hypothetical protein OG296_42635 [Streptomyces sp. NBC_01001]